jgi:hypothetical protein
MDDSADDAEIYGIAMQCKGVFADCVANPALGEQAWIRSAQGDFNLWCAGIKATSTDKSSLDYRLRRKPDMREAICDLLRGLVEALRKCQQLIVGEFKRVSDTCPISTLIVIGGRLIDHLCSKIGDRRRLGKY